MHGANMMFLFAVPVMEAFAVYLVPLMIGTRNIAFPRLNAFSYWMYLAGGIMLWALSLDMGPDIGWFAYVPLSGPQYGAGKRADMWAQMITFTEVSALAVAVEIVVTVFKQRAPGMSLDRIPLFVWSMLVTSFLVIMAMPAIMVASTSLILDRLVGTHFFNVAEGGDVLLWQHLFWFFGHPEVYIIFVPAVGMVSTIVATFARRPIFGYLPLVLAVIATGVLAFGLWVHHMFTTGLPRLAESFFTASSMAIAVPSGIQNLLLARRRCGTAGWCSERRSCSSSLSSFTFVIGGHDRRDGRLRAVGHAGARHLLRCGAFPLRADRGRRVPAAWARSTTGIPKIDGPHDERAARPLGGGLVFVGFNLTFFPMHILGLQWDAAADLHLPARDAVGRPSTSSSVSALAYLPLGFLLFFYDAIRSARSGPPAGDNPWDAGTLEWATASPPPAYNFALYSGSASANPLWDERDALPVATGLRLDRREIVVSRSATRGRKRGSHRRATPSGRSGPRSLPAIMLMASIFSPWAVIWGSVPIAVALIGWFWPKGVAGGRRVRQRAVLDLSRLPLHGMGSASVTWWGTLSFMLIEGTGFALVIGVYLYLESLAPEWPIGAPLPDLGPGSVLTIILLISVVPNLLISRWAGREELRKVQIGIIVMACSAWPRWCSGSTSSRPCMCAGTATPTVRSFGRC